MRIMPLGDSITFGVAEPGAVGGYRNRLYSLLSADDYNVDFVGTFEDESNGGLPDVDHQGLRGAWTTDIQGEIAGWLDAVEDPDVVLLLIGTNDIWNNQPPSVVLGRLYDLIDDIVSRRPFARVIVSTLPARIDNAALEAAQVTYNAGIPGVVADHVALGHQVSMVDMHPVLTPFDYSSDGVHPSTAGYNKMADAWFAAVSAVISPQGSSNPPVIARVAAAGDLAHVSITFSKPVADDAADPANFSISGGLTVTGASLDGISKRTVTLGTSPQTPGFDYVVTVNGVRDRTAEMTEIAPESMARFTPAPVVNGSFEDDYAGWTVTGNHEIQTAVYPYTSTEGGKLLSFNSGNEAPGGSISQTFATTPGMTYRLLFDYGVLSFSNLTQQLGVSVQGASQLVADSLTVQRTGNPIVSWFQADYTFIADSASATLTFTDESQDTDSIDLLLDHVRIEPQETVALAVTSSPDGGAEVSISPTDLGSHGGGSTGLIRFYDPGSIVTVTAPLLKSGKPFQHWRKNGVDLPGSGSSLVLTMDADVALDAVYASNQAPVADDQTVMLDEDGALVITLTGTDPDGESLAFAVSAAPVHGHLAGVAPALTYTPDPDFSGPDVFSFTVTDGSGAVDEAQVSISVNEMGGPPIMEWLTLHDIGPVATGDSDGDGIRDAVEFVIGGDPDGTMDAALLPNVSQVMADPDGDEVSAPYLLFSYPRTAAAQRDASLRIVVEWSENPAAAWTEADGSHGEIIEVEENGAGDQIDLVRVSIPLTAAGRLFARLKVVVADGP